MIRFLYSDIKDKELIELISGPNVTGKYFSQDRNCPIDWEPSGFDFLSPCLQVNLNEYEIHSRNIQLRNEVYNTSLSYFHFNHLRKPML